jgi:Ca-activated chloride channel family protein
MNREQAESLLAQLVFDDLEEPARSELLEYLKSDPELNERLGDMRLAAKLLRDAVEAEGTPTLDERHKADLRRAVERDQRKRGVLRVIGMARMHPAIAALVVISTVAILVGLLLPATGSARRAARQMKNTTQVRGIVQGLVTYAGGNKERLPGIVDEVADESQDETDQSSVVAGEESRSLSTPSTIDFDSQLARVDAARRKLAVKGEQESLAAAESAGAGVVTTEPNLNERFAGRGFAWHSQVSAGESGELQEFYDRSVSRGTLSAGQSESEVPRQQVAPSEELGLSAISGSERLGRTPAEGVELYDGSTVGRSDAGGAYGAMGGYGVFAPDDQNGAIALNEPADQSGREGRVSTHYFERPPMAVGDEVARGGTIVLGDDVVGKPSSVQSQSTPAPAATPTPQIPALADGVDRKLAESRSGVEFVPNTSESNLQWYAKTKDISQSVEERLAKVQELTTADAGGSDQLYRYRAEQTKNSSPVTSGPINSDSEGKIVLGAELRDVPAEEAPVTTDFLALDATQEQSDIKDGVAKVPATPAKTELASRLAPAPQQDPQTARKPRLMPVNPWVMTADDQLSTFALDVDTAAYDIARRYIHDGFLPPRHTVRMEEFVNSFDYNYPNGQGDSEAFTIHTEAGEDPFGEGTVLLKVGVRGKVVGRDQAKPAHLVFVVDTSGSMDRDDRLPLVRQSLAMVLDQLAPQDHVTVVGYGTEARLLIESAPAEDKQRILDALESLQTGGSTNLLSGIALGYEVAQRHFITGGVNRVILCSDGVANVGPSEADDLLNQAQSLRRQGVTFTSVGFGAGNYDDRVLEQLANKGDGGYLFVGSPDEAKRVFVDNFAATRPTIAYDAKIQVDFDPARVRRYRLIGYENRDIADKDFRNDAVDAGEVGSGQSATALYELELLGPAFAAGDQPDLGTVYVRYRDADTGEVREIESRITNDLVTHRTIESNPRFYLAASAARFAEVLRGSEHVADPDVNRNLKQVQSVLESVVTQLPMDASARELLELVHRAQGLPRAE